MLNSPRNQTSVNTNAALKVQMCHGFVFGWARDSHVTVYMSVSPPQASQPNGTARPPPAFLA